MFSTSAELSKSDSLYFKVTSLKKVKFKLFPKSLFTPIIGLGESLETVDSRSNLQEPIVSVRRTSVQTNLPIQILEKLLVASMAMSIAVPNVPPIQVAGPAVPIAVQMGAIGDYTASVALLTTFSGWPSADPDKHLSQFLTACIANNGRTEDVWLRWLLTTLEDIAFEWYNC